MAKPIRKTDSTAGCGALAIAAVIGLLLSLLLGPTGMVLGVVILAGTMVASVGKGRTYLCGNCRNPLASAEVKLCPACREPVD